MNITILRDRLYKGTLLAGKIITTKSNLPILSNLALHATSDNQLEVLASNLEISIRLVLPAKVTEPGQITVPARKFIEYLGSLTSEQVDLSRDQKQIVVSAEGTTARFVTMPMEDFPVLPEVSDHTQQMIIKRDEFRPLIRQTIFAAATGDTHPVLSGVLFDLNEDQPLQVVATDSFRLSLKEIPLSTDVRKSFIVPAAALREVDHVMAEGAFIDEESPSEVIIKLSTDDNQLFFKYGTIEVIARLLEAEFPNYKKVIPTEKKTTIEVQRVDLINAIKRTAIFAAKEGQSIKMECVQDGGTLTLSAQSVEVGSHSGVVPAQIEGEDVTLAFNSKYLLDGLDALSGYEVVVFDINGPNAPIKLTAKEQSDFLHVVMPMSLNEG